nr:beta-adducin isoform X2 [Zootoca vivipara]
MSSETIPEEVSSLPTQSQHYFDRFSEDDPEYLRIRNMAADLRQDFNLMEQKKRVTMILQSPSFREELESLIQEQMKKGNNSNIWALRQIADFMASTAPSVFPPSPLNLSMVTPINDLQGIDSTSFAKGERLMRCKVSSVHRLLDLYGWAQLSSTCVTLRVSKEQDHFLICPVGLSCPEVTASSLVKVNILGEVVEAGSTSFSVDTRRFSLHSAIYAARPDVRCIIHLHTPATAAVSAMKHGLLPISHDALLAGNMVYFDFNGEMEEEADRIELQKCLGPTCKVLVLRNHGVVALGDTVEEAFYKIFHLQAACEVQISALSSAGGAENLIVLEREKHCPHDVGSVRWAGSTFGPMQKSRLGEHEFEALMRMLDNLGYRTGYAYRYPFVQEKTKHKSEVEIPATVTAFVFEEDVAPISTLRQHAQKQQKEKTRWLNTPNTYLRVNVAEESQGSASRTKTTSTESHLADGEMKDVSHNEVPPEPEPPNPFSQLTDQELEEYKKEVERKKLGLDDEKDTSLEEEVTAPLESTADPTVQSPAKPPLKSPPKTSEGGKKADGGQAPAEADQKADDPGTVVVNGKDDDQNIEDLLSKGMSQMTTNADTDAPKDKTETVTSGPVSPEGSPSKSPSKKKKKFRAPSFLKKSKKKEKTES